MMVLLLSLWNDDVMNPILETVHRFKKNVLYDISSGVFLFT